jgi:protein-tyrosine phosphatase
MCNGWAMASVLFVCTGNLCRSPCAELLMAQGLDQAGTPETVAESAGISGADFGPPERLIKVAREFGIDLTMHQPRKYDREMGVGADLVIGMSREHVREVVVADQDTFVKTFTLREIVRRGQAAGPRRSDETLGGWLVRVHEGRRHADLIGDSAQDDIDDPMGGSSDDYRRMLKDVSELIDSLVPLGWS